MDSSTFPIAAKAAVQLVKCCSWVSVEPGEENRFCGERDVSLWARETALNKDCLLVGAKILFLGMRRCSCVCYTHCEPKDAWQGLLHGVDEFTVQEGVHSIGLLAVCSKEIIYLQEARPHASWPCCLILVN